MNILAAPLLFEMPEIDAYYTFLTLMTKHCSSYAAAHLEGVHSGCHLVDEGLKAIDLELYNYLFEHGITATIYAFPLVLSLFACAPPLSEALRLWDTVHNLVFYPHSYLCFSYLPSAFILT